MLETGTKFRHQHLTSSVERYITSAQPDFSTHQRTFDMSKSGNNHDNILEIEGLYCEQPPRRVAT